MKHKMGSISPRKIFCPNHSKIETHVIHTIVNIQKDMRADALTEAYLIRL